MFFTHLLYQALFPMYGYLVSNLGFVFLGFGSGFALFTLFPDFCLLLTKTLLRVLDFFAFETL